MLRVGLALAGGLCRLLRLGGAASRRLAKKGGEGQSGVGEDDERREVRVGDGGVGAEGMVGCGHAAVEDEPGAEDGGRVER